MNIYLERASKEDLVDIVRIYNQAVATRISTADLNPVQVADRISWFEQHTDNRPLLVVKQNNQIAGWVSLTDFYGRVAYQHTAEISIYIDQAFQGQHLGTQIMTLLEPKLASYQIKTVVAFIFHHNLASQKLFKKFNFAQWGHLPGVAELDGVKRDLDILGKQY